ncbi:daptide biosynthesis RiPP recognition protein [Streptomyces sp. NPDC019990]|uniref:daptide biosynthesis RiPP recognition protein n=1 Tax=Streptomyces sp. NPDC019990 TaxID=3154693 RepID=UPI0033E24210
MTTSPHRPQPERSPLQAPDRLQRWFRGHYDRAADTALEVVAEPGADLSALAASGLLDADGVVFAEPGTADGLPVPAVPVEGSVLNCGDDLVVADELHIQVFDYVSLGFVALVGCTVVRITGEDDLESFLADADAAVTGDGLPQWLVHPSVVLADTPALAGAAPSGVARLYVAENGMVRTAPGGADLAPLADGAAAVRAAAAARTADPALDGVLPAGALERARAERPWLPRYLRALDAARTLSTVAAGPVRISGFGMRLCPGVPAEPVESTDLPLIARAEDGTCFLLYPDSGRTFKVSQDVALLAEAKMVCGDEREAHTVAAAALGIDVDAVRGSYSRLTLPEMSAA